MMQRIRSFGFKLFVVAAIVSFGEQAYSAYKVLVGEMLIADVVGSAEVKTGSEAHEYVTMFAVQTRYPFVETHVYACGEIVDDMEGLKMTFLGDVYTDSPKVEFKPLRVAAKR